MRKPKAFLEQVHIWNEETNRYSYEWFDDFVYIARQPLIDRGYEIVPFDGNDVEGTLLTKNIDPDEDVIVASVDATIAWFKEAGVRIPDPLGYPESLEKYLGRTVDKTTFGELGSNFPYFVKPAGEVKLFTGDVVKRDEHLGYIAEDAYKGSDRHEISNAEKRERLKDMPVFVSDVVEFVSEYRCFIMGGVIKGIQWYQGDFQVFPDASAIRWMANSYHPSPSCYTLDVGVTAEGHTVLVEVNDMWAIGSYGFNGKDYALMCARRMKEIVRTHKIQ